MAQEIGTNGLIDTWASSGSKEEPGLSKKETGWEAGERPPHEFFNHILSEMGQKLNYLLRNGVPEWSAAITYTVGNMVQYGGDIYAAIANNVNSTPSGSSPHWSRYLRASTIAEAQAWASSTSAITPAMLAQALKGANQSLTVPGYQRLPGGLIMQWGNADATSAASGSVTVTFPIPFPTGVLQVIPTDRSNDNNKSAWAVDSANATQATLTWYRVQGGATNGLRYFALGY